MIKSVTIEGFKSFGSPAKTVALERLNFIVGANASGKTNFVSALKFIQLSLLHGLDFTVNNEFGGCRETRNRLLRERGEQKPCCFRLRLRNLNQEFNIQETTFTLKDAAYLLKADLRSDDSNPVVISEDFKAHLVNSRGEELTYSIVRTLEQVNVHDPTHPNVKDRIESVPPEEKAKLSVASGYFGRPAILFRQLVAGWTFFNISSQLAREPAREIPGMELGGTGANLAAVLHEIEKHDGGDVMKQVIASLRGAVPQVRDIKPVRSDLEGKWSFQIVEDRIRALNPISVSDGTIRLLTLLVAAYWAARNSSLVVIEEPENNLHPHLNEQLVATFRAIAENRQIIVTTHNPGFLDYLEPQELLLCERDKETTFTNLIQASSRENIDLFRRKYSLGDLWVQGVLGGIPQ
ncbi:MAG TPA: AAA family ATPase [Verrucomicrobiae bacterium]|nr:AAA family ATPase [Verrucomicrobiae bacterium]